MGQDAHRPDRSTGQHAEPFGSDPAEAVRPAPFWCRRHLLGGLRCRPDDPDPGRGGCFGARVLPVGWPGGRPGGAGGHRHLPLQHQPDCRRGRYSAGAQEAGRATLGHDGCLLAHGLHADGFGVHVFGGHIPRGPVPRDSGLAHDDCGAAHPGADAHGPAWSAAHGQDCSLAAVHLPGAPGHHPDYWLGACLRGRPARGRIRRLRHRAGARQQRHRRRGAHAATGTLLLGRRGCLLRRVDDFQFGPLLPPAQEVQRGPDHDDDGHHHLRSAGGPVEPGLPHARAHGA